MWNGISKFGTINDIADRMDYFWPELHAIKMNRDENGGFVKSGREF